MSDEKNPRDGEADLERLAKEYVDLWESQIKAFTSDENLARTMAQTMELMNAGAANVAAMMQHAAADAAGAKTGAGDGSERDGADADHGENDRSDDGNPDGAPAAGAAPGDPEPDVHELANRIAELERRLARLEGLSGPAGKVAPGKTKKG